MLRPKNYKTSTFFYHISLLYLYMIVINILMAALFFAIGKGMNWFFLPLSFAIAIGVLVIFYNETIDIKIVYEILAAILILIIFIYFAGRFYDTSWDGNGYHKLAIGLLKNQWNPFQNAPTGDAILNILGTGNPGSEIWVEAYCKVTWFLGASIYFLTGNIESGKVYTVLGMFCVFWVTFYFLRSWGKKVYFSALFSLVAMLNPIAVQQLDTFYIDGFLHSILYILVVALVASATDKNRKRNVTTGSLIAASMIICGNIKFTGLLYGGLFCIAYFVWYCISIMGKDDHWVKKCLKRGINYAALAIVTVFWAGSSSYLTNFINHGSFTYPLTGENSVDIMTVNSAFSEVNRFKNLFLSLFSEMDNFTFDSNKLPILKIPFSINWEKEKAALELPDVRISGFGILFSGILIIAIVVIVYKLLRMKKDKYFSLLLMNVLLCVALTIGITESWWARYAPYIYFIVLIGLYIIMDSKKKFVQRMGIGLSIIALFNSALFLKDIPKEWKASQQISTSMKTLNNYKIVDVYTPSFSGIYFNLKDQGVYYKINSDLADDTDVMQLGYLDLKYKIQE